jgi:hypothetical protein
LFRQLRCIQIEKKNTITPTNNTMALKKYMILFLLINTLTARAQNIITGFYNCENFYDTINQIKVIDEDFLPTSAKSYTRNVYDLKSYHLSKVIYALGKLDNGNGIALMGLVEIENKLVLEKLIAEPLLKKYHYKYLHFDSKDQRGIDVALIYNPLLFIPYQYRPYSLTDATHFKDYATRDILYVKGRLDGHWVHILVNHWPSRRGGAFISKSKRIWAATVCKNIIDSVCDKDSKAKFIVMGDFNDNPNNRSLKKLMLYNPFLPLFKKGFGSIAYRDSWSLFDQILLSPNWASSTNTEVLADSLAPSLKIDNLTTYKPIIYTNPDLIETQGKYRGYPKRTYDGDQFRGGYSDHFPVALIFKAKNAEKPLK